MPSIPIPFAWTPSVTDAHPEDTCSSRAYLTFVPCIRSAQVHLQNNPPLSYSVSTPSSLCFVHNSSYPPIKVCLPKILQSPIPRLPYSNPVEQPRPFPFFSPRLWPHSTPNTCVHILPKESLCRCQHDKCVVLATGGPSRGLPSTSLSSHELSYILVLLTLSLTILLALRASLLEKVYFCFHLTSMEVNFGDWLFSSSCFNPFWRVWNVLVYFGGMQSFFFFFAIRYDWTAPITALVMSYFVNLLLFLGWHWVS